MPLTATRPATGWGSRQAAAMASRAAARVVRNMGGSPPGEGTLRGDSVEDKKLAGPSGERQLIRRTHIRDVFHANASRDNGPGDPDDRRGGLQVGAQSH